MMNQEVDFAGYATVLLDISIDKALDYGMTHEQKPLILPGTRVEVPIRGKLYSGYILNTKEKPDFSPVKPIAKILSDSPLITEEMFRLAVWMAKYYCCPLRQIFKILLPSGVRKIMQPKQQLFVMRSKSKEELRQLCEELRNKHSAQAQVLDVMLQVKKGILLSELLEKTGGSRSPVDSLVKKGCLIVDIVRIDRSPLLNEEYFQSKPKILNDEQASALDKINRSLTEGRYETHLLYGVTGSGKTEVYIQAIDHALKLGKGAIMLVPEISLTEQTIQRFRSRFQEKIAVLHYRLSQGERNDEWHKIHQGEARIVIGARSAVFSPVKNLGLIIVDEEHEQSYKQQEETPCYHGRDVAVMRSKMSQSTTILGSATPSLESYYNAKQGKYTLSTLTQRASHASLPNVRIIDMKKEFEKANGFTHFSDPLIAGIKRRQELGEQTILFLNRRGYHTTLMCQSCGKAVQCAHCDLALTFHLGDNCLACHLCGYRLSPPPSVCPSCRSGTPLKFKGAGTEQIEKAIHAVLPDIRTIRVDGDTTRHKGSHQKLLRDFGAGKADILIGTQMISKGLHFPSVTLVGVLNSDASLNIPDFRSSETVFQLITQVSGRAGRGVVLGEVIIQTMVPENATIQLAAEQNYPKFYDEEIAVRQLFRYPPFSQLAKMTFSGKDARLTERTAQNLRQKLTSMLPPEFELHPVAPCGYAKVKDHFRFQFLIKGPHLFPLNAAITAIQQHDPLPKSIKVSIDINPSSTFF